MAKNLKRFLVLSLLSLVAAWWIVNRFLVTTPPPAAPTPTPVVAKQSQPVPSVMPRPVKLSDMIEPVYVKVFGTDSSDRILAARAEILSFGTLLARQQATADSTAADVLTTARHICMSMQQAVSETSAARERYQRMKAASPSALSQGDSSASKFFSSKVEQEWRLRMAQLGQQVDRQLSHLKQLEESSSHSMLSDKDATLFSQDAAAFTRSQQQQVQNEQSAKSAVRVRGYVLAVGPSGCIVHCEIERAIASHSAAIGMGDNVYAPPSSDVEGDFVVAGLQQKFADGDLVDVTAAPVGIEHNFRTMSGDVYPGSHRVYRAVK